MCETARVTAKDAWIGRTVGKYRLERRIGQGATGVVYRASGPEGGTYAVKLLAEALAKVPMLRRRFEREARVLDELRHPNIVAIQSFGIADDAAYLVMEYLEGQGLDERLHAEAFDPRKALMIMAPVLDGLAFAHDAQIVHRDLKPANVFWESRTPANGGSLEEASVDTARIKLLDFGLAKFLSTDQMSADGTLTRRGRIVGTPAYMAPEQISGLGLDARVDVYAAGILLYELLADARPFEYESRSQLLRAHLFEDLPPLGIKAPGLVVDERLERVIRRALAKDPEQRYANASELRAALADFDETAVDPRGTSPRAAAFLRATELHDDQRSRKRRRRTPLLTTRSR